MEADVIPDENNQIEKALKLFSYFEKWNKKTISDCCRLSKIRVFPPDNIVFASDGRELNNAMFIMEGICKIIEHLQLVPKGNPKRRAKPRSDNKSDSQKSASNEPKYTSMLFNIEKFPKDSENLYTEEKRTVANEDDIKDSSNYPDSELKDDIKKETTVVKEERNECSIFNQFYRRFLPYISAKKHVLLKSSNVDSHFLQIGLVYKGCCLGLGEHWQNRFLVSVTEVTCMVIPLQFLLQHNPNNIWNRIKQFLNSYLPNEEKVLSEFFINRQWCEDKRRFITSKKVRCTTKINEVPKSIRLNDSNKRLH